MILAGTGHRPQKIPNYRKEGKYELYRLVCNFLKDNPQYEIIISGGAIGFDTILALSAIRNERKLITAVPCKEQDKFWSYDDKKTYAQILDKSDQVVYVSEEYSIDCMQKRNIFMIDNCDEVIALWDGVKKGGTYNAVKYAEQGKKKIINIWDSFNNKTPLF